MTHQHPDHPEQTIIDEESFKSNPQYCPACEEDSLEFDEIEAIWEDDNTLHVPTSCNMCYTKFDTVLQITGYTNLQLPEKE